MPKRSSSSGAGAFGRRTFVCSPKRQSTPASSRTVCRGTHGVRTYAPPRAYVLRNASHSCSQAGTDRCAFHRYDRRCGWWVMSPPGRGRARLTLELVRHQEGVDVRVALAVMLLAIALLDEAEVPVQR